MILTNHFSPTGHPWPAGPNDKSSTYVLDLRLAIPGQKPSSVFFNTLLANLAPMPK